MQSVALSMGAALLLAGAVWAQQAPDTPADPPTPSRPAAGMFADADGDGVVNCLDPDFVRPGKGNHRGPGGFVDADGDGVNDLALDADGDGIPNGQDEDYVQTPAADGTGRALGAGRGHRGLGSGVKRAPDGDGDGTPNCLDGDSQCPYGGTGLRAGGAQGGRGRGGVGRGNANRGGGK